MCGAGRQESASCCHRIAAAAFRPNWQCAPSWPSTAAIGMFAPSFAFPRDMGCYARLFPFAQVVVLVPIIIIPLFFAVPAILFFGLWSPFSPDAAVHRCSRPPSVSQP